MIEQSVVNGYSIDTYIGKGSFGSVYKCVKDDKAYAMKLFNFDYVDAEFRANGDDNRFIREIEALKKVNHKNAISYIDHGSFVNAGQKYFYIVMEYIEGRTLTEIMETEQCLRNADFSMKLITQLLEGLEAIHNTGIVHRDLKPDNIRVTDKNEVKILDFGLSKLIDYSSITETGMAIGSPLYMSPEQIRDGKRADLRSDLYSVGVILYCMLTGRTPFRECHNKPELYRCIIEEKPLSPSIYWPTIPNVLENIIMKLLSKEKHNRYSNANELLSALLADEAPKSENAEPQTPEFILRLYNEKGVLEEFYKNGYSIEVFEFPINLKETQLTLHSNIRKSGAEIFIDPATLRLAYSRFRSTQGLLALPYAPKGYDRISLEDINTTLKRKQLVKAVIDYQLENGATKLITPYFYSQNSEDSPLPEPPKEDWFITNHLLAKECVDYVDGKYPLYIGVAIKSSALSTRESRTYFLDTLTGLGCDGYFVSVDRIDNDTNPSDLFNYATTMLKLQKITCRPVFAGRVNCIGLGLIAHGLTGFSSGAACFDSFYEGLLKDETTGFNLYVKYYIPELLLSVPIFRIDPQKLKDIFDSEVGSKIKCTCPFCKSSIPERMHDKEAKLHFLYRRNAEIEELRAIKAEEREAWFMERIKNAEELFKGLSHVFKKSDYSYLKTWKDVLCDVSKEKAQW